MNKTIVNKRHIYESPTFGVSRFKGDIVMTSIGYLDAYDWEDMKILPEEFN